MKKLILPFGFVLFLSFGLSLSSCQEDCANCKIVTYDVDGNFEKESAYQEYCGEDLDAVDGTSETDNQGIKTEYVCD
ncbi:MAG: hypothetical protein J7L46_06485 [Bacteroidales bacterium]|nr:hypothetical protein [Bacteroidales bacterium]